MQQETHSMQIIACTTKSTPDTPHERIFPYASRVLPLFKMPLVARPFLRPLCRLPSLSQRQYASRMPRGASRVAGHIENTVFLIPPGKLAHKVEFSTKTESPLLKIGRASC